MSKKKAANPPAKKSSKKPGPELKKTTDAPKGKNRKAAIKPKKKAPDKANAPALPKTEPRPPLRINADNLNKGGSMSLAFSSANMHDLFNRGAIKIIGGIKNCKISPECAEMNFIGFHLTGEEYKKISKFIADKESLDFIIVPQQGDLFDK